MGLIYDVSWGVILTGLGALFAGIGSFFTGLAALKAARVRREAP